jgi:Peptidase family M48
MTVALALLAGAAAVGWWAPRWLGRADLRRRDPLVLIVAWLLSMVGCALAAVVGVILMLLPNHGDVGPFLGMLHHCWETVHHGSPPQVEELGGILGVIIVTVAATRLAVVGVAKYRCRARTSRQHLAVLRVAARPEGRNPTTLWLAHDGPLAFSLAGRPGAVVATEGLTRHLPDASVAAVLEHERAHLRGRHHLLVAVVDTAAAVFSVVPLFRRAPAAMRELVEITADTAAVRACGMVAVRTALLGMALHDNPGPALTLANDATDTRLARLWGLAPVPGRRRRTAFCLTAGFVAATSPFLVATSLLFATAMVLCHVTGP